MPAPGLQVPRKGCDPARAPSHSAPDMANVLASSAVDAPPSATTTSSASAGACGRPIARSGSLTAAAEQLDTQQPTLSRQLSALERELGVQLFQRSSRSLSLSDAGRTLLPHAAAVIAAADVALQSLQAPGQALSGRLRVACSIALARRVLLPALPAWIARHP